MFGQVIPLNKVALDALGGSGLSVLALDAAVASAMTFLKAELEKMDPKVREPLASVTYMRDIVIKTGGGFVDWTSVFNVDYATAGPNMYGLIGTETNAIPTMQANIGKDLYPVFTWANVMKVPFVDQAKLQQVGRSLEDLLDKGIRLNYNKALDLVCYQGFGGYGGLINNSNITITDVDAGASGDTDWESKTPEEILSDINSGTNSAWAASEYDVTGIPDTMLVPPAKYARLLDPISIAGVNGAGSILEYVLRNNVAKQQGVDFQIFPCRWCISAGEELGSPAVASQRALLYKNDEDRVYMDITVPIQRAMTMPDVNQVAYLTLYLAQVGVPKFLYYQPVVYLDGI